MGGEKSGESLSIPALERRSFPRYSVDEDSVVLLMSQGGTVPGNMENLSLSGCRVRTRERISAIAGSRIEISFKVNGTAFRCNGTLEWTYGGNIAGIRFVEMVPGRKAELAEILGEVESAQAAMGLNRAADQGARSPAPPSENERTKKPPLMFPQNGAGKTSAHVPGEPGNRAIEGASTAPASLPAERRTCARQAVDTSAAILLINVGSTLRGRIVDLSQGGCRIRTDERFPVGIFTRVETEFRLQGLPFRLGGVIQAIHNRNTVGIRFLDLSDRKRQQVAELIGEIQQTDDAQMAPE